jgi:hypothetical protein
LEQLEYKELQRATVGWQCYPKKFGGILQISAKREIIIESWDQF